MAKMLFVPNGVIPIRSSTVLKQAELASMKCRVNNKLSSPIIHDASAREVDYSNASCEGCNSSCVGSCTVECSTSCLSTCSGCSGCITTCSASCNVNSNPMNNIIKKKDPLFKRILISIHDVFRKD